MALRAYIGTARDVRFDENVTEHGPDEEEQVKRLPPIARDPILEMKYREALKNFPNRRGRVDPTKIVVRKNKEGSGGKRFSHGDVSLNGLNGSFRNRSESFSESAEEEKKETISQATYLASCTRLKVEPTPVIYKGLAQETIVIKYHPIGEHSLKATCIALVANTMVATLDLTAADIGDIGAIHLADVLRENLYLLDLSVAENNIGTEGIATLCQALQENRALKYLNISGNRLTELDAEHIRDMLLENTTLKGLNVSHNDFTDLGGVILAEGIEGNDALEDLDISWNHLRQRGANRIIESLLLNNTIKRLDLSYNGFHDASIALGQLLSETTCITYLDLTSNRLTDVDMGYILKGFASNATIETLLVGKNPFTAPFCYQLLAIVCENPENKVKELDLDSQSVEVKFLDLIYRTRETRQLYINHGTVLKAAIQREAADDFANSDPMMVLMECIAQRNVKLVDLFQSIDKDDSKTITRNELREGLKSLNIPMSNRAIDKLMKKLDIDENGEIDFAEFMEGQREYLKKKQAEGEAGAKAIAEEEVKMKEKVAKLIKMRRLAKMAQVLDNSTEQLKRVIKMNKVKPTKDSKGGAIVDEDSVRMERMAKQALALFPKVADPVVKTRRISGLKPVED